MHTTTTTTTKTNNNNNNNTAIQDQVILTRNYKKYILSSQTPMSYAEDVEKNRRQFNTLLQHVSN